VAVNQYTTLNINKKLPNNLSKFYQHDTGNKWHKHSEVTETDFVSSIFSSIIQKKKKMLLKYSRQLKQTTGYISGILFNLHKL
jgi:hypothetical protein